jgi:hypothetical protein
MTVKSPASASALFGNELMIMQLTHFDFSLLYKKRGKIGMKSEFLHGELLLGDTKGNCE